MQNLESKTALGLSPNIGAMVCYVGNFVLSLGLIYSIAVVVTDKTNKLVRFHAWQSILASVLGGVLGGIGVTIAAVGVIIDTQIGFPLLSLVVGLILLIIGLVLLVMYILATVKAYKGEIYRMPLIGGLADKWSQPA